jgi:DNA-binding NarL/FixJ family response regulator
VTEALGESDRQDAPGGPDGGGARSPASPAAALAPLTAREREVALLLARGLTNREIARELVITEKTAGVHVEHILRKLGLRSRTQVATWVVERGEGARHAG